MTIYVGIDPGLGGAIASLDGSGAIVALHDTPVLEVTKARSTHRHEYDARAMALLVLGDLQAQTCDVNGHVYLEEQQARPHDGPSQAFGTGKGFGIWIGILSALAIPYTRVHANSWKFRMHLDADKEKTRLRAIERWPQADLHRKKDHGRAEALFLAEFCRQQDITLKAKKMGVSAGTTVEEHQLGAGGMDVR